MFTREEKKASTVLGQQEVYRKTSIIDMCCLKKIYKPKLLPRIMACIHYVVESMTSLSLITVKQSDGIIFRLTVLV